MTAHRRHKPTEATTDTFGGGEGDDDGRWERAREHRKVLLFAVPVVFVFGITDSMFLHGADLARALAVRILWAVALAVTAVALPRVSEALQRRLLLGVSVASAVFFALI